MSMTTQLQELLVPWDGKRLNTAAIGRLLGVSAPTVAARVRELEREGLVRLLPFFGGGKRRLLYLRQSTRGNCIATIITRVQRILPGSRFFWWKTGRVRQIDLLVEAGEERIGFCVSANLCPQPRDWWPLRIAHRRGLIDRGYLLYTGKQAFVTAKVVQGLPMGEFLKEVEDWILHRRTVWDARKAWHRINFEATTRA